VRARVVSMTNMAINKNLVYQTCTNATVNYLAHNLVRARVLSKMAITINKNLVSQGV
jgi:hypothetical protein